MSPLERDLIRWERGEVTLEDVEAAHPEVGIHELVRVHTRLSMLRAIPMPDVERAWSMTISRLDDRAEPMMARMRAWVRKPLIASFASVVMTGGAAYAAGVDPVERAVDGAWAGLTRVVTKESRDARDVAAEEEREAAAAEETTSESAPVVTSTEPPGHDDDGEHGKSKTKGKSADHRKDEQNRHRGWVNKKDKDKVKEEKAKPPKPATPGNPGGNSSANGGGSDNAAPPAPSDGNGSDKKDDASAHSEASDGSAAPAEDPPAPPAPPANSNAGGNGGGNGQSKAKDKTRL
jgi:hypothetical protein